MRCWRLDAGGRTAVFASLDNGVPALVHFGRALPPFENLGSLARLSLPNVAGGQLDSPAPLSLFPTATDGWQGHPGIGLVDNDGTAVEPALRLTDVQSSADRVEWQTDDAKRVRLTITARLDRAGLLHMKTSAEPRNGHGVRWLCAGAVPVPDCLSRIVDHGGRWTGEFRRQETRFRVGQHVRESREGRTGHAHFPGVTFLSDACGENSGECMGATLCWSGGHRMIAEEIPDGRRQLQFSVLDDAIHSDPVSLPEMILAWSEVGLNGLSQAFHTVPRSHHADRMNRSPARPVHYNCWEAVYFRHSVEELQEIASRAAALGAERFVLDDGWFKGRNDDTSSLGDWTVDPDKYPQGLSPLVDHVLALGMRFGIWFEPEMVNTESDLFRAHPDWVLGPAEQPSGRNQHVLDLSKVEVREYLFDAVSTILSRYPVDYVKWDHNRILTGGSPAQTFALYDLLSRLNAAFPDVEFESCASGGGRIDYGILAHTTRVWLSDSNDAVERLRMQHEASRWLPPEFQGSHVGPRRCHTSGRILPMSFRAWVAAQRHMGFEMDPRELTDDEANTLEKATGWYRANRDFLFSARHFRIESNDPEVFSEVFVAPDASRFVLFRGQSGASCQIAARPFPLPGLETDASYEIGLVNAEDVAPLLNRTDAVGFAKGHKLILSGAALMAGALRAPNAFPHTMLVFEGTRTTQTGGRD
ncbi:alpha-galactosidase [Oricola thermophila]|uniref:alpha-galactosidase n=1 Tax=Oricola thermophila TaxID=2742145 RepID=A0A6N1VIH5_9HYPH|nr:alpha-galactosidase [Oricola thermophila]